MNIDKIKEMPIKLNNIPFAIFITANIIIVLAAIGWLASFMIIGDMTATAENVTDFDYFMAREGVGITLLGMLSGIYKLFDIFTLCLRCDVNDKKD